MDVAEQAAWAIGVDVIAVHVGVSQATLLAVAEELRSHPKEDPDFQRFSHILDDFDRWKWSVTSEFDLWRGLQAHRASVTFRDRVGDIRHGLQGLECSAADLLVIAHPGNLDMGNVLRSTIFQSGKPVIVTPRQSSQAPLLEHVVIGWKPHMNAYHMVQSARRWLEAATRITVLCVDDWDHNYVRTAEGLFVDFPSKTDIRSALSEDHHIGHCLIHQAHELHASCLAIGAYNHEPLFEVLLGHVTRYVLAKASIPILLKH